MNTDTGMSVSEQSTDPVLLQKYASVFSLNAYYGYLNTHCQELLNNPAFMLSAFYHAHEMLVLLNFDRDYTKEMFQELIDFTNNCDEKYEHVFRDRSLVMKCPEFIRYATVLDRVQL